MHCITFAFSQCFMDYRCVISMLKPCVLVGLDWTEPMMFLLLHVTWSCIFHAYVPFFSLFLRLLLIGTFLLVFFSLSFFRIVYTWHASANPLCPETFFVMRHLLLLILHPLMSSSIMTKSVRTFRRTFLNMAFIRNARLSFRISLTLIYPLSLTVGVGNPFVISWSVVPL